MAVVESPRKNFWFEPKEFIDYLAVVACHNKSERVKILESLDGETNKKIFNVSLAQFSGDIISISSVINVKNGQTITCVSESKFKEIYADSSNVPPGLYCITSDFVDRH